MGGEENTLEQIILVSDSNTSEIETVMELFKYKKQDLTEATLDESSPKTIIYVTDNKAEEDENLKFLLNKWIESDFVIVSKMTNGGYSKLSEEFHTDRLFFLDRKYINSKKGKTALKKRIKEVSMLQEYPELRKTIPHIQFYKNKLYVLLGPSGVGKTTSSRKITTEMDNIKQIKQTTTRPPRSIETEKNKNFVEKDEFERLEKKGELFFIQEREDYKFGLDEQMFVDYKNGNDLIYESLTWETLERLKETINKKGYNIEVVPIFLVANKSELIERFAGREEFPFNISPARYKDIPQELEALMNEFDALIKSSNIYPYFIENTQMNQDRTINIVKNIITFVRTRTSGETFVDSVFTDLFSTNFENRDYITEIIFDNTIKNYIVDSYVNQQKISEEQKNKLFDVVNKLPKLIVNQIDTNKNDSRIYIEKPYFDSDSIEAEYLQSCGIRLKDLLFKLLQAKTKYMPSAHNVKQINSSEFNIDYDKNSNTEDLIGWTISDTAPNQNCDSIKYVGISFKDRKTVINKKSKTEYVKL